MEVALLDQSIFLGSRVQRNFWTFIPQDLDSALVWSSSADPILALAAKGRGTFKITFSSVCIVYCA